MPVRIVSNQAEIFGRLTYIGVEFLFGRSLCFWKMFSLVL